ncbi:hypothetical protein URH17368_1921 [Alicyclobacillus hesperidum URH17-3-68]|uniref:Uncharacterized protein n=1 Tax=Alicyclobacillus hesperidum TaxID=89784 RepID=A0A1H2QRL3_9BACL|nr:hypothetical protein [Alicyclobacillus hesperidum]EJY55536.1 hypothetical protein URH17368_1921 [Alicyclobacillus hesperidum URH17-3-68]GLG01377.1 hypothetical protein Alches_14160 [Alicyclobacillus hesperidum subsp. aegles]GLV13323.1 hypothetical protein Heshes_10070 [Alicyclobacillus hesperidum]SDW09846.1 hypothetical protein SAMN04489725_10222 [Alicyclobacillus hesperidum]
MEQSSYIATRCVYEAVLQTYSQRRVSFGGRFATSEFTRKLWNKIALRK